MDQPFATVIAASIAGTVATAGWFVTKFLDRRQKTAELRRAYLQRQIEELYGPLHGLLWQMVSANNVKHRIFSVCKMDGEARARTNKYFAEFYFLPLHTKLREIVESKLYLIEGSVMPDSLWHYLEHSLQEAAQHALWFEQEVDTSSLMGMPFPNEILLFVKTGLDKLMVDYELNVQELKGESGRAFSETGAGSENRKRMA